MESIDLLSKLYVHYGKDPMSAAQESEYVQRINAVPFGKRHEFYSAILETCRRFPSVAELVSAAKEHGVWKNVAVAPVYSWVPSDCRMCGGSGLTMTFWEQEFDRENDQVQQLLRLSRVVPYQRSSAIRQQHPELQTALFRCDCISGEQVGLPRYPRWGPDQPQVRKRAWS